MPGVSRMKGNFHVRLCVQQRLACAAGARPAKARVRNLVARMAGRRATASLKPIDISIWGMLASPQAVAAAHAPVAPHGRRPGGRAGTRAGAGRMARGILADAAAHASGVGATAGGQGHAEQLEKPSASHRARAGARSVVAPVPRDSARRREGGGGVRRRGDAGQGPWSPGTRLFVTPLTTREAGATGPKRREVCQPCDGGYPSRRRRHRPGDSGACGPLSARGNASGKPPDWPRTTTARRGGTGCRVTPSRRRGWRPASHRDATSWATARLDPRRPDARPSRPAPAPACASCRARRCATGWCKGLSRVSWRLAAPPTSQRGRRATAPSGAPRRPCHGWRKRSCRSSPASSPRPSKPPATPAVLTACWRKEPSGSRRPP